MIKINRLDIFNNDNPLCIKKNLCVSSYLILCFYHLIKDFISNWKCYTKEAAP